MQATRFLAGVLLLGCLARGQQYGEDRCSVYPDPHFHTFDGNYYDFHFPCEFDLLVADKLLVQIRTERMAVAPQVSIVKGVAIESGYMTLSFEDPDIFLNGASVTGPPATMPHPTGVISITSDLNNGWWFHFKTGDSMHITQFSGSYGVELNGIGAGSAFWHGAGLCGKYDGNNLNDFTHQDGTTVTPLGSPQAAIDAFALTWEALPPTLFSSFNRPCDYSPPVGGTTGGHGDQLHAVAAELCAKALPDQELFQDCVDDVVLTGDVKWANNPVYDKPMRCQQGCACDKHHPKARCLDRCLIDHDCFEVCPNKGCVCNVPREKPEPDPLCTVNFPRPLNQVEDLTAAFTPKNLFRMCKDNGCKEKGGRCRPVDADGDGRRDSCECVGRDIGCPKDARTCPDGTVVSRDPDNNCQFPPCPNVVNPVDSTTAAAGNFVANVKGRYRG